MKETTQETQSMKFEASMARLQEIVRELEKGEAPLDESLALFQEGTGLVSRCTTLLDEAELEVKKLVRQPDGTPAEVEFEHEPLF